MGRTFLLHSPLGTGLNIVDSSGRSKSSFRPLLFSLSIYQVSEHAIEKIQSTSAMYVKRFCKSLRMLRATCFCHIGQE